MQSMPSEQCEPGMLPQLSDVEVFALKSTVGQVREILTEQLSAIHRALDLNEEVASQLGLVQSCPSSRQVRFSEGGTSARSMSSRLSSVLPCMWRDWDSSKSPISLGADPPQLKRPKLVRLCSHESVNELIEPLIAEEQVSNALARDNDAVVTKLTRATSKARLETLFPQVNDLKQGVEAALAKTQYDVEKEYKESGFFQALARSSIFKDLGFVVIFLNTLYIGIEIDSNRATILSNADLVWQICDNLFCGFFCFEIFVRFMAFRRKLQSFRDPWFLFDLSLAIAMAWETWALVAMYTFFPVPDMSSIDADASVRAGKSSCVLRVFRLFRLCRVARATRLLKTLPELLILSRGILIGMRSVLAVGLLQIFIVYIFSIIFTVTLRDSGVGDNVFDTVPSSMNALLLQVLCGPDSQLIHSLLLHHWSAYAIFIVFICLAIFTVLNMLIGILCGAVQTVSDEAQDELFKKEVEKQIDRLSDKIDEDRSGSISHDELDAIISDPEITAVFTELGVDIVGLVDFAKFIYVNCDELSYVNFAGMVAQFREDRFATLQDIATMRRYLTVELMHLEDRLEHFFRHALEYSDHSLGISPRP